MTRVRSTTTGGFTTNNSRDRYTRPNCASAYAYSQSFASSSGVQIVKTIEDVQTPGFHTLLKCGEFLPLNPVTISEITETRIPGTGETFGTWNGSCFLQRDIGPQFFLRSLSVALPPVDEDLVDTVVTNAIANAKAATFDALTFAAELRQTTRLVGSNYNRITRFAEKAAKTARRFARGKREILSLFSQLWLEYQFGWKPLIHDTQDALRAFRRTLAAGELKEGFSRVNVDMSDSDVVITAGSGFTIVDTSTLTGSRIYRGKAYGLVTGNGASYGSDILVTGYEIIPYSFLVDYFINIGGWLQAITPFSGAKMLGSQCSIKDTYTLETEMSITYSGASSGVFSGNILKLEGETYQRFPHSGGVLPHWNPRLTPTRVLNILALIFAGRSRVHRHLY